LPAEIGVVHSVADGLEIIGGVPGKVRRNDCAYHGQDREACPGQECAAHRRVQRGRQGEPDQEIEHGILGQDTEPERRAERCACPWAAAAPQPPGQEQGRAPEWHQHPVSRQHVRRQRDSRHQGVEEGGVEPCLR